LPGLQAAIKAGTVQSFKQLTGLNSNQFYEDDKGVHYAQARYLCYYLQQRGLLTKFYREFHAHQKEDPTGYKTLRRIVGRGTNMSAFQRQWQRFVLGLQQGYEVEARP
jgi:hypothetical protein